MVRLKLGMVGGGQGAFIGGVHRMAARLDGCYELVAGAFASDSLRAHVSAAELGVSVDRSYDNYSDMAKAESARPDAVSYTHLTLPTIYSV